MSGNTNLKTSVLVAAFSLAMVSSATARTITVDCNGPSDFNNIQAAIDDANDGDIVVVGPGTYTGDGNRDIDFNGKAITVMGENGPTNSIIDCQGDPNNPHRAFIFQCDEGPNSVVSGFTITNGYSDDCGYSRGGGGGGILCSFSSPTIKNCILKENIVHVQYVCCVDCFAHAYPGGAGISCYESSSKIINCIFQGNSAIGCGGAFRYVGHGAPPEIINCTFYGNQAGYAGGWGGGGAIGIIGCEGYDLPPKVRNCIIWGNAPKTDPGIVGRNGGKCAAVVACADFSVLQSTWQGKGQGNIVVDPCFADAANGDYHLQSQAGRWDPNQNDWVYDANTSPCIDAGNPGCPLGDEPNSLNNVRINMGAYGGTAEASKTPVRWALLADLSNDRIMNFNDLAVFANYWLDSGQCIPGDLNRSQSVDFIDLKILAVSWLKHARATSGIGELEKPGLSDYYTAYESPMEPNAPGYALPLDMNDVWNYEALDFWFPMSSMAPGIEQHGFAVLEGYEYPCVGGCPPDDIDEGFTTIYEQLRRMHMYLFITSDTLLHIYHVQFDETLKEVEENEFIPDINDLTKALLSRAVSQYNNFGGDLQDAAKRNVAYLAVANKLIDPSASVPAFVDSIVASELAKIDAHAGFDCSDLFLYMEDYSQYVPRGHYTRSEDLKRYFRTLMWYGRMAFLLKGAEDVSCEICQFIECEALVTPYDAKIQTMQAILLATSIEEVDVAGRTGREIWDRMYAITSFYVGLADDLTPYEYIEVINRLFCGDFNLSELEDEDTFFELKAELSLLRSPEIYGGTGNIVLWPPYTAEDLDNLLGKTKGMRFMGQRFIPDSYMFQHLVFPEVTYYTGDWDPVPFTLAATGDGSVSRGYPRGLDVMAILGSTQAEAILAAEGDTDYVNYALKYNELKDQFDAFDVNDWNRNLYWGWLYSLRSLVDEFGEGYPNFMRTDAWEKKELNAALASWTELRHDTILYAKQSYTPIGKGGVPPPPDATGYVEPVPEFYRRLLALSNMTQQGLSDFNALSPQAEQRLESFKNILSRLAEIADKELLNQDLSSGDFEYIGNFAETLEETITGVDGTGISTVLVADVHTHSYEERVVEEGVGYVDLITVACQLPSGSIILTVGPVLSYYEFKHPMSDRLTDEAWRQLLDSPQKPDRPEWFQPFVH
ncbi:MAG: DUF3160 domain-containing protein [Desulfobacteraceae bacterium]|nr:DUF3160 domain-containing protein [Desulfobacteraceae bacterium]